MTEEFPASPLAVATIDDIYDELKRRYPSFLLALMSRPKDAHLEADGHEVYWAGGWASAIGLCEYAKHEIIRVQYDKPKSCE